MASPPGRNRYDNPRADAHYHQRRREGRERPWPNFQLDPPMDYEGRFGDHGYYALMEWLADHPEEEALLRREARPVPFDYGVDFRLGEPPTATPTPEQERLLQQMLLRRARALGQSPDFYLGSAPPIRPPITPEEF